MIRLVVLGLSCFAVAINAVSPLENNDGAEALRMVQQANCAEARIYFEFKTFSEDAELFGRPAGDITIGASSTGGIFFFMKGQDLVLMNGDEDIQIMFTITDLQDEGCKSRDIGHACPRTIITGRVNKLDEKSDEHAFGLETFVRHNPFAAYWKTLIIPRRKVGDEVLPSTSLIADKFYLCKLDILTIKIASHNTIRSVFLEEYYAGTNSVYI